MSHALVYSIEKDNLKFLRSSFNQPQTVNDINQPTFLYAPDLFTNSF